jgi:hypothetical protein
MGIDVLRTNNVFARYHEGDHISVEELASKFLQTKCRIGYEVSSAGDDFIVYNLYAQLDAKRSGFMKLILDKKKNDTKIVSKGLVTWAVNWSKLIKPRR